MTEIDQLRTELDGERSEAERRDLEKKQSVRIEEILGLRRVEFRHILLHELLIYLVPYIQDKSGDIRFVIDHDTNAIIPGFIAHGSSKLNFRFNPRYDGHDRIVYDSLQFYQTPEVLIPDSIVQGMREIRDNVATYFRKADLIGDKLIRDSI